jgi:hypothetical protein
MIVTTLVAPRGTRRMPVTLASSLVLSSCTLVTTPRGPSIVDE